MFHWAGQEMVPGQVTVNPRECHDKTLAANFALKTCVIAG